MLRPGPAGRTITHDLSTGRVELSYDWQVGGLIRLPNGLEIEDRNLTVFSIVEGDPLSARVRSETAGAIGRGEWRTRCETVSEMTCDADVVPRPEHGAGLGGRQARLRADLQAHVPARPGLSSAAAGWTGVRPQLPCERVGGGTGGA